MELNNKSIENEMKLNNKSKWCHEHCYEMVSHSIIDPVFYGICHESCQDEKCKLDHSDFDIDYMP